MAQPNQFGMPPTGPRPGFPPGGPNTMSMGPPQPRMGPPQYQMGPPPQNTSGAPPTFAGKANDGQIQKPPMTSNGDIPRPLQNGPYIMQQNATNTNFNGLPTNYGGSGVNGSSPVVSQASWTPQQDQQGIPLPGGPSNYPQRQGPPPIINTPYSYSSVPSLVPGTINRPSQQQAYQNLPPPPGNIPRTSSQGLLQTSSEPNSARSSRNPSPLPNRSYDSMEGQFPSPRPSPVNSSTNLQALAGQTGGLPPNLGAPPPPSNAPSNFPSIPPPPSSTVQSRSLVPPPYMGHAPAPVTHQPQAAPPRQAPPPQMAPTLPSRPRYPQQPGYNQASLTSSQANNAMTPVNQSYGNSYGGQSYGQQQPMPATQPDGPVGGVPGGYDPQLHGRMAGMSIHNSFSRMWGNDSVNLLQDRNILPPTPVQPPRPVLTQEKVNCSPDIFRCTLTKVPENSSLLQKSRLPLGILIHPFKDVSHLPVIQCNTIVRCRSCRTYINPFVSFVDQRRWKCNLCYRINDLPEEFFYDPASGTYGDPTRRPEVKNATIEFIAPSEYMLRPPQPAIYLFLLDVSHSAIEIGYLNVFCQVLVEEIDNLPGDARTRVGIITYDSAVHFYSLCEGMTRPQMMVVSDIDEMFVPLPDNLLVNLNENKTLLQELLTELPTRFAHNDDTNSALGAALQAAFKMVSPVGGRVTVMQATLPNIGPGALKPREDPNQRAAKDISNQCLGPASDFYKKMALDCSGQQVAVDLFLLSMRYCDVATLACVSKFSSGCVQYYPGYHQSLNKAQVERYENDLRRYLTRKIGFEAVMRIRCTRGLSIHTFHGNFFVRSTDLLSLPNINPDSGFGMQISIEENLTEANVVCFQAAVLYTSSKGERRIRVHTLSLPVCNNLAEILGGADQQAIIGLLSKMAVDRSITASLSDARDALINACIDILTAFKQTLPVSQTAGALMSPYSVRLVPLYAIALLKHPAFRVAVSTKLDERVYAMEQMKTLPLAYLLNYIYPNLYPVHALDDNNALNENDVVIPQPPILQLSFEKIDCHGAYLLDTLEYMYLYIGRDISPHFCQNVLGVPNYNAIQDGMYEIPELETPESNRFRTFVSWILSQRPFHAPLIIVREDSKLKQFFVTHLVDDRSESSFSYYEFLQHLKQQISK